MTVVAVCSCGAKFQAKDELAGQRVKCPACGQPFRVAKPQISVRPIHIACPCGKALQAKADLAGQRVKCPACGQPLAVPYPDIETDAVNRSDLPGAEC